MKFSLPSPSIPLPVRLGRSGCSSCFSGADRLMGPGKPNLRPHHHPVASPSALKAAVESLAQLAHASSHVLCPRLGAACAALRMLCIQVLCNAPAGVAALWPRPWSRPVRHAGVQVPVKGQPCRHGRYMRRLLRQAAPKPAAAAAEYVTQQVVRCNTQVGSAPTNTPLSLETRQLPTSTCTPRSQPPGRPLLQPLLHCSVAACKAPVVLSLYLPRPEHTTVHRP